MERMHEHHDHTHHQAVTPTVEDSAAFLLPHLTSSMEILDVGCGAGNITLGRARHLESLGGNASQIQGMDVSGEALNAARSHAADAGLDVTFFAGSAESLPVLDNSFDVAYASQSLHHMDDPIAALRELARVVRPGGLIAARELDFGTQTWYPPSPGMSRWRAVFTVIAELDGLHTTSGRQLLSWFHRASLSDANFSSSTWSYASTEDRRGMADVWIDRMSGEEYTRRAAEALGDVREDGTPGDLAREAIKQGQDGWNEWASTPGAIFVMSHFEVIARVSQ